MRQRPDSTSVWRPCLKIRAPRKAANTRVGAPGSMLVLGGEGYASLAGMEGAGGGSTSGKGSGSFPEAAESRFHRVTSLFI